MYDIIILNMRKDKEQAIHLRRLGKSYKEIRDMLRVPKSTLSDWFASHEWSQGIKTQLQARNRAESKVRFEDLSRIRGSHLARMYEEGREEAVLEFHALKHNPLFIAAVTAYWGEGDKLSRDNVRICNTDPAMIKLFLHFLIYLIDIDKQRIAASLLLYPDLEEAICKEFWNEAAGLSEHSIRYIKTQVIEGRHKTRRLSYGVCNLNVSSAYFKKKMLVWMELLPKELFLMNQEVMRKVVDAGIV